MIAEQKVNTFWRKTLYTGDYISLLRSDVCKKVQFGGACCLHLYFSDYVPDTTPNMKAASSTETLAAIQISTWRNISEEWHVYEHSCENNTDGTQINFCCLFRQKFLLQHSGKRLLRTRKSRRSSKYKSISKWGAYFIIFEVHMIVRPWNGKKLLLIL